jgi:signal transduction histidine kinase
LKVNVRDDRQPKPMTDDTKAFSFQAVRELLTNVKKHARATCCTVSLTVNGDDLEIWVEDDGEGFNPEELEKPAGITSGFGLFSIRERLEPLGADLEVKSQRGKGTTAKLVLPLIAGKEVP